MRIDSSASRRADALFGSVQQRVLALLFGCPERDFQSAEVIRLAKGGTGAAHRELRRLADAGWLTVTRIGNQKHYRANPECPGHRELHELVVKTLGVARGEGRDGVTAKGPAGAERSPSPPLVKKTPEEPAPGEGWRVW